MEAFGGVPRVGRTDRIAVLGQSRGKGFVPFPATVSFCAHHGFELRACLPGDAQRKGKVCERSFGELKSAFLPEMDLDPPADVAELNRRAAVWLDRSPCSTVEKNHSASSSSNAYPAEPTRAIDRVIPRRSHAVANAYPALTQGHG